MLLLTNISSYHFLYLAPFENPPVSRDGPRPEPAKPVEQKPPPTQEEINMLIDEEMSMFPEQKYVQSLRLAHAINFFI